MSGAGAQKDFFISYTGVDEAWAAWIAAELEAAGYSTVYQGRDFHAGGVFPVQMDQAMRQATRTIAVLSPEYLRSRYCAPEWAEAFRRDPTGEHALLVPVRVRPCELGGLLGARVYIDLVDVEKETQRTRLLAGIANAASKVLLPAQPPGGETDLLRPLVVAPTGLPLAASLVGREAELAELLAQLRAGTTSGIFAVEGMGGVGKTALAAEAVARLVEEREAFPGGAAWIACEGLEGEAGLAELWARVALALDLEQMRVESDPQRRRVVLATALAQGPRLLLALDNVEPGLDAEVVLATLAVRGHTVFLVTARQQVVPHRVMALDLAPLPTAEARTLFLEHLVQNGGHHPTPAEEPALLRLLEAIGGLPLALELTAAYVGGQRLNLERVLREVEQDGLHAAAFRADPKRALHTRFERSWAVLAARQQRLLAGLSLLAGASFPRAAALAVGQATLAKRPSDAVGDLATLVNYALVEALPDGERLRLHQLLREYAAVKLARLPQPQRKRLGEAMVAFWLAYAEGHPGYEGMDALEAEAPGLLGALAWTHDYAHSTELLALGGSLGLAWRTRGRRAEELRIYSWAGQAAIALGDAKGQRWAAHQLARTFEDIGQMKEARQGFRLAKRLARETQDLAGEWAAARELALLAQKAGWLADAKAEYEHALALVQQWNNPAAEITLLHDLAMLDKVTGRVEQARAGFQRALGVARQLGDWAAEQKEGYALAMLNGQPGRLEEARKGHQRTLEEARQLGDPAAESAELRDFGFFLSNQGEVEQGRAVVEQSLAIEERLKDVYNSGKCHEFLAYIERDAGNTAAAMAHFHEANRRFEWVQSRDAERMSRWMRWMSWLATQT